MKPKLLHFIVPLFIAYMLLAPIQLSAQIVINAPTPADNPNLAGNSPWSAICAGTSGFNQYYVNVTWAGVANGANEFVLELSDDTGDFTAPVELARVNDQNANPDFDMEFAIPTDTRGNGYKLRVKSTSPASTGQESAAYNMYYMDVTTSFNISELGDGVPPGSICSTGPITLLVDTVANPETYQYIWFKDTSQISGETGHTLNVSETGTYNAFIDYGPFCSGSAFSNYVDVTIGSAGQGIFVNPPANAALCAGDTETLSINTTDASWSYKWYKDNAVISGATTSSYTVDASSPGFEGDYQVEISSTTICTERSAPITITNADNFTVTRDNAANVVVLPSQAQTLSISTTANTPTYQWYRNGVAIGGATNNTFDATQDGTYYASVTQGGGTCPGTVKNSEETLAVIPASFEIIIDYVTAYTACVSTSIVLEISTINAVLADNSTIDVTADVVTSFSYQWKKDGVDVSGETASNISLTNPTENGDYLVEGTLSTYNATSNTLAVQLLTSETVSISSTSTVYCNSTDTITINTTTDLSSETFAWERDGVSINTTDAALVVSEPGTYRLTIDKNGCPLLSNEIPISPLDPDLITLNSSGSVIFPEGSSGTVIASGGTGYLWYDAGNVEISNTDAVTVTEPGTYTLIANIDNCEITKQFVAAFLETFKVPNVITPNGDGANDQWVLPNSYANKTDVTVTIYNDKGIEIMNTSNYQNNWPDSSTSFPAQNMVFYYVIKNASKSLKQGTITVIR